MNRPKSKISVVKFLLYSLCAIGVLLSAPAFASKKVALVVGNDQYENVPGLNKAVSDAATISGVLQQTGFDVIQAHDLSRRAINQKLHEFISRVEPGDVAMFYYAGHGVEIKGQNYLLPVDVPSAVPGQEGFVKAESISLASVLDRLREKRARLNIVVLDACRNNPFKNANQRGIGSTRGLAAISPPKGTFILYSADAGEAALDALSDGDTNPNSVFTRVLAPMILKQDVHLAMLARDVRREVKDLASTVQHDQTPAYYDAVLGDFYFSRSQTSSAQNSNLSQKPAPMSTKEQSSALELAFWKSVENSENVAFLESYIQQYPNGKFIFLAKAKMKVLQEKQQPQLAKQDIVVARISPAKTSQPLAEQYKTCEAHLKANRLTSGQGGNAYDCYREILDATPNDPLALSGMERIEDKYANWARKEIGRGNKVKAGENIEKLRTVNPESLVIAELLASLETAETSYFVSADEQLLTAKEKRNLQRGIKLHEQYKWDEAFTLLEPLIEKNTLQAKTRVANMLQRSVVNKEVRGDNSAEDGVKLVKETAPMLVSMHEITDSWYLYFLGLANYWGDGIPKDYKKAMKLFRKSAHKGSPYGTYAIGTMYLFGKGVDESYDLAMEWYQKAAEQGFPAAKYNIAWMYGAGKGVEQNYAKAMRKYRKLADSGYLKAQSQIGWMYASGHGVEKDYTEAMRWYRKAADNGFPMAQTNIGWLYKKGNGVKKDFKVAMAWFRKSATQGSSRGKNSIGILYQYGQGVTRDYAEAMKWFQKAADNEYKYAQYNIGTLYRDGKGVEKSTKLAFDWFKKAAEQGHKESQYQLGLAYHRGSGIEKDDEEAQVWYRKAAKQDHSGAKASLSENQVENASLSDIWKALKGNK